VTARGGFALGRRRARVALGALAAAAVLVGWAAPASAHAAVVSSSPAQGAHLAHPPHTVTVVFDQPVQPDAGGLVVLNSTGQQVQSASAHPSPSVLRATLPGTLPDGAYVANYTVTSVDGHVVSGAVVFLAGKVTVGSIANLARPHTSWATRVDDFGQFLMYLGFLVAAGLAFFAAFVLGAGAPERPRLRRWFYAAVLVGVAGMLVTAGAQAALTGGGAGATGHWAIDRQALDGKLGEQFAVQLAGLAACIASFALTRRMSQQFTAFYGLLAAAGGFVLFGHAIVSPERWLSIPADIVHAVFAAMWAGGLVGLVVVLRHRFRLAKQAEADASTLERSRGATASQGTLAAGATAPAINITGGVALLERPASGGGNPGSPDTGPDGHNDDVGATRLSSTIEVVRRFSTMAGLSFACILVAGFGLAVAEVGSLANLFGTGYGQLLLVKLAAVALLLFVAGYNRYLLLPWLFHTTATGTAEAVTRGWARLRATVRWEAVGMVAVLGLTSILANGTPSNGASLPPPVPFTQSQPFEGGHISLHISPNQALVNNWTVQFTGPSGLPVDAAESVSLYLVEPQQNIGPIETDMHKAGVGRFVLTNSPNPPVVGHWQVVLQIQVSAFSQPEVSFSDTVQ
jgi:copper transport protein